MYTKLNENLFYTRIPYKDIFTTVYLLKTENGCMMFDCASYDNDIDDTVKPFLESLGVTEKELKYVFISHNHKDHAGGLKRFLEVYPNVSVITKSDDLLNDYPNYNFIIPEENQIFLDVLKTISIPGHSPCSQGILDTRNDAMLTGDSLQLYGIFGSGDWCSNIKFPKDHFEALEKLEKMKISAIYTAHDYHPLGQFYIGEEKVKEAIDHCRTSLLNIKKMILENPSLSDEELAKKFNAEGKLPKLGSGVIKNLRYIEI